MMRSGTTVDTSAARENFGKHLDVFDPVSITMHTTTVASNQILGRWLGG